MYFRWSVAPTKKVTARVALHVRRRSLDFSTIVGRPTHWLTFFARRSTLVARALGETRIGWTRRGYGWRDATGRDATLRDVLFFAPFLPPRRCSSNRGRKERQKNERVDVLLRRLGRPAELSCVNARGRLKKKRGRASPPTGFILPRVHHVEKRTKASVKKRRVGVARLVGSASRGGREGEGKKGEGKGCRKGCRVVYARFSYENRRREREKEREMEEGTSREGKDVGREGRNRSLMQWWGSYVR